MFDASCHIGCPHFCNHTWNHHFSLLTKGRESVMPSFTSSGFPGIFLSLLLIPVPPFYGISDVMDMCHALALLSSSCFVFVYIDRLVQFYTNLITILKHHYSKLGVSTLTLQPTSFMIVTLCQFFYSPTHQLHGHYWWTLPINLIQHMPLQL